MSATPQFRPADDSSGLLRAIVESSDDAIVGKALDGTIVSRNAGAHRMYGYTASEAVGQSIALIIPLEHRERLQTILGEIAKGRRVPSHETVRMIPPPSQKDDEKSRARYAKIASGDAKGIGGTGYYGYERDLYTKVAQSFSEFGQPVDGRRISLHRGLFEDTLQFEPGAQVAFAHVDCDWYEPVRLCLDRLYLVWSIGGYFVIDDYNDYGGCRRAVDEFLAQHDDVRIISSSSNLILQRRPGA